MKKRLLVTGILVLTLVLGMAVIGCDDNSGGGETDTWSNVTSLTQLNGTWKTTYAQPAQAYGEGIKMAIKMEYVMTVNATNATTGTMSGYQYVIMSFIGSNVNTSWSGIKEKYPSSKGWTPDDEKYILSGTSIILSEPISLSDMDGVQINQNGTKVILPADFQGSSSPELMYTKQ